MSKGGQIAGAQLVTVSGRPDQAEAVESPSRVRLSGSSAMTVSLLLSLSRCSGKKHSCLNEVLKKKHSFQSPKHKYVETLQLMCFFTCQLSVFCCVLGLGTKTLC